ncbi:285_t:CDS:2, partial [Scutellospora calospora]
YKELKSFTEKVIELVREPYIKFIDISLFKLCFSLRLLGPAKEGCIKRSAISSANKGFKNLDNYLVQPKENYSAVKHLCLLIKLSENNINVKEIENVSEAYSDFISEKSTTTLIRSLVSYCKTLSNETKSKIEVLQKSRLYICYYQKNKDNLAIYDWNVIIVQVKSTHHLNFYGGHSHVVILDKINSIICQIANKGSKAIYKGLKLLQEVYTSTVEAGIFFKISNHFDSVIGISNINTGIHAEAFAQIFYQILCSLIASTGATLELISAEDTKKVKRNVISYTIKNTEKKIKDENAELIANASDITPDKAEILKQNPICSFTDNIALQHYYL